MTTLDQAVVVDKAAGSDVVLQTTGLTVEVSTEHGWVEVVDGVDLTVRRNETVGLVGESGSGKTLTSLAVMGLLPENARISRGDVRLSGRTISGLSEKALSDIRGVQAAMIFQEPRRCLNPAFTVGDQVAESIRRHRGWSRKQAKARVIELFELVEIPDAARRIDQYPHEFSGGMCQRVMLAMALACDPELLIADEPTTALDVTVQRQVLELIRRLQGELGLGVLLITHDLSVVAEMCDRVTVMYAGQVVESAPVDPLFYTPKNPYTSALLQSMLEPSGRGEPLGYIPGSVPPPHLFPSSCRFQERCTHAVESVCGRAVNLENVSAAHLTRCARAADLALPGVSA
ncbi:dipeptide ABC transporter ATP-binding protein DppD [Rhodococcus sp. SRB_17]|uniref:ABC transporter ATP-binding protein n=1 Tax=Rhodococcus sp. OK302 TaxID=1882769 RepID=UPI000B9F1864|nr:ABC transporter ATP-binding protein [Rhodococcus sp. OK302]NMM83215.1 dipeptide ABC transporter ATP-binding protein DppD [Rhodococcus sp. SRB_17]OYD70800.1 peptide/nickel transport system ATP-binding protein/oligopeptide transport system ATP-binding protein [Rhodococcus sp. OK302]